MALAVLVYSFLDSMTGHMLNFNLNNYEYCHSFDKIKNIAINSMDEFPVINICIPTYKRNEYLNRLLNSIYESAHAPRPCLSVRIHIFDNNPQCGAKAIYDKWRLLIEDNQAIELISYRGGLLTLVAMQIY